MSELAIGFTAIGALLLLLSLRVPIGVSLIGVSFIALWKMLGWTIAFKTVGNISYSFAASWTLSAIPLFLLMGYVAYHAGLTDGLFAAARAWMTRIPGGLAIASVTGSSVFAAMCGSSIACAAAMGRIAIPEMTKEGYNPAFASSTVAVAGTIGALIPPSIVLIIFGVMAEVSIVKLFLGGVGVGLLSALAYIVVILVRVLINPELAPNRLQSTTWQEKFSSLRDSWPMLLVCVFVFGGLFGGVFTPTEAGAIGAFLTLLTAVVLRRLSLSGFWAALSESLMTTSTIIIIGVGASIFARMLVFTGVETVIQDAVLSIGTSQFALVLVIMAIYLILGMFLEPISAMLLTLPIMLPLVGQAGLEYVWFGVFLAKLLEVGMVTPPVGMNIFVIKQVVGNLVTLQNLFRGTGWFILADLVVLLIIYFVPDLVMWLPNTVR